MATGSLITNKGKEVLVYRSYTRTADLSATSRTAPYYYKIGMNSTTPAIGDTALNQPLPISNGTVNDDGDNTMTGSSGGDNTTDNTTTFKEGAGATDDTSQNLKVNATSGTKTWTISNLAINGSVIDKTKPYGFWLYIADQTTLDKLDETIAILPMFRTNGDGANYMYCHFGISRADLSVGWTWVSSNKDNVEDLTEGNDGPPSGTINEFKLGVYTNNATDVWDEGKVCFDLLRQWSDSDLIDTFTASYPQFV